jgi:pimeloyl-ACP methyl ester carboxylesterase
MLQPSQEALERQRKYETFNEYEAKLIRNERMRIRALKFLSGTAVALSMTAIPISQYNADVQSNQEIQAQASISVQVQGEALDKTNNDNALVFIDGFGSYNADKLTKYMSKAVQPIIDGQLWSVDYNNAPLETEEIAKNIISTAAEQGVNSISLVGYSAGGDVTMQVQEEIRKESNLEIKSIFLVSTPDGAKALRPQTQGAIDLAEDWAWVPGIQYSTTLRYIGELAFRADRYNFGSIPERINNLVTTSNQVQGEMENSKFPGAWLMFDQVLAIQNANLSARFDEMAKIPKNQTRPTIVYLGTAKPGYDYMIDDKKSSDDIAAYAEKAGIPFFSYDVPGAVHTRIDIANDAYIKTLVNAKPDILTSIAAQEEYAELHRVTSMTPYDPSNPPKSQKKG